MDQEGVLGWEQDAFDRRSRGLDNVLLAEIMADVGYIAVVLGEGMQAEEAPTEDQFHQALSKVWTVMREATLAFPYRPAKAVLDELGLPSEDDLETEAEFGQVICFRDYGAILVPDFQFAHGEAGRSLAISISTAFDLRYPSWNDTIWWTVPGAALPSVALADLFKRDPDELSRAWSAAELSPPNRDGFLNRRR